MIFTIPLACKDSNIAKKTGVKPVFSYPRAESNRNRQNRNLKFYPLNYGGGFRVQRYCFSSIISLLLYKDFFKTQKHITYFLTLPSKYGS